MPTALEHNIEKLMIKPLSGRLFSGTPTALQQLMARLGPIWGSDIRTHSELVKGAYAPLLANAQRGSNNISRNLPYGSHARQVIDIFRPSGTEPAPVVVFVHGGAFVRGDKCASTELYDNVLHWFAAQGCLGINLEYRLAPESAFPGGAEDVALAMSWLHEHVAAYGGDPQRIFLVGHSAGGTHVASYVFDPSLGWLGRYAAGVVLVSARLRADDSAENPNVEGVRAYFGSDPALYELRSPVTHATCNAIALFVVTAEFENPLLDIYGLEFAYRASLARRRAPRYLQMAGHNHMSIVAHFNSGEELLGREILDFMATTASPAA